MLCVGLPLVGAQLAQTAINATDSLMIGWLGAKELGASVVALQLMFILWIGGLGILQAVVTMGSYANGQEDVKGVRRSSQMGVLVALIYTSVAMVIVWNSESLFLSLGQSEEVSQIASQYLRVAQWSMYPSLFVVALRSFLTSIQLTNIVLWSTIGSALVNGALDYVLIFGKFGFPKLGIQGAGVATIGTATASALIVSVYILRQQQAASYKIFTGLWRFDPKIFIEILKMGIPVSIMVVAEVSVFSLGSIMIGWIGTLELAAHGIVMQITGIAFMIPLGFSQAASARAGNALGRSDKRGVFLAGWSAIALAVFLALLTSFLFATTPEPLISAYLDLSKPDSARVVEIAIPLLYIGASFQILDNLTIVSTSVLRGLADTKIPLFFVLFSKWIVGIPVSYFCAFNLELGANGIWIGAAAGLAVNVALLMTRFYLKLKYIMVP